MLVLKRCESTAFSKFLRNQFSLVKFSSTLTKNEDSSVAVFEDQSSETLDEDEIMRKRNKSRLWSQHLRMLKDIPPYDKPVADYHSTIKYTRKMFGKYGKASQVDPGTLWPNQTELNDILEFEKVAYPFTFHEMVAKVESRRKQELAAIQERQEKVIRNLQKVEQWKQEVETRKEKKLKAIAAAKAKRDALLEEVRRQFGFKIDTKDERFQQAILQKEKDQKKKLKEEKAKAKQDRLMAQFSSENE